MGLILGPFTCGLEVRSEKKNPDTCGRDLDPFHLLSSNCKIWLISFFLSFFLCMIKLLRVKNWNNFGKSFQEKKMYRSLNNVYQFFNFKYNANVRKLSVLLSLSSNSSLTSLQFSIIWNHFKKISNKRFLVLFFASVRLHKLTKPRKLFNG